jgi:deferrochelatase/peroxidase EfeB
MSDSTQPAQSQPDQTTEQPAAGLPVAGGAAARSPRSGSQAGITNRPPEHVVVAAVSFAEGASPQQARVALDALRDQVRRELASDIDNLAKDTDTSLPFPETGELGVLDGFDRAHLTITVGLSHSGMAALGVADVEMPADLCNPEWEKMGPRVPTNAVAGDLVLQICTDSPYVAEHVLRRMLHSLRDSLTLAYAVAGVQRYTSRAGRVASGEARSLIGFHDGVSNLNPNDPDDAKLIFVKPGVFSDLPPQQPPTSGYQGSGPTFPTDLRFPRGDEPAWAENGTYMVVRASVLDTTMFDASSLGDQQTAVGRYKLSGAPLDLDNESDDRDADPAFANDQSNVAVPVTSHLRKANPRRDPDNQKRLIFRRGYPLVIADGSNGVRRGLVFIAFGRTITTQFEFIMRAWIFNDGFPTAGGGNADRLLAFETEVLCGGYYFVPPLTDHRHAWTWGIPAIP